jgi:flagellar protein FliS
VIVSPASRYRENEVTSMSPSRRVVFLYSHVLANLRQARRFMEQGDIEGRSRVLIKAREVINELLVSLDHEQGGEIAVRLSGLYAWFLLEIDHVERKKDIERLERMTQLVAMLHETWDQAANLVAEFAPATGVAG